MVTAAGGWRVGRAYSEASGSRASHRASGAVAGVQSAPLWPWGLEENFSPGAQGPGLLDMETRGSSLRAVPLCHSNCCLVVTPGPFRTICLVPHTSRRLATVRGVYPLGAFSLDSQNVPTASLRTRDSKWEVDVFIQSVFAIPCHE